MDPILIARSVRRSALRTRILLKLAEHERAYPRLLAQEIDVSPRDLLRAMHGRLPQYSPTLSPIALGLVKRRGRRGARAYEITRLGHAVAKQMRMLRGRR